ncbi:MAG: lytic transglycosylase domain-containing protein, partial [Desulforhabdus sp.]|nr:lytic transglycosylase domain-containing protein [Desulforhabdus sp.]
MAPSFLFRRHQLGEAANGFWRIWLKAAVLLCLILTSCSANINAKTDLSKSSWGKLSNTFLVHERPIQGDTCMVASLTSPSRVENSSPAGKSNNKTRIQVPNQPAVQKYIGFYKGKGRLTFIDGLERSWLHLPLMVKILESRGVPAELIYVVLVESSFKSKAMSPGGAGGYWQLLPSTARSLGLRVDRWVDERMDPVKSTEAAAKYLRMLYDRYNSWPLALAAYNAGDGPVQKAIKKCGTKDFWTISKRGSLPRITRAYVPKILAAIKIARDLENHDFDAPKYLPVFDFDSTYVKSPLKLQQVAVWLDVPVKQLRTLNPSL